MDASTAALIGATIGVTGGALATWVAGRLQRDTSREARREDRRAKAYVEVAQLLLTLRAHLRTMADRSDQAKPFADADFEALDDSTDRANASVTVFGSREVRDGVKAFSEATSDFLDLFRDDSRTPEKTQALRHIEDVINALTDQMNKELHP
jgi:hypothetical protein